MKRRTLAIFGSLALVAVLAIGTVGAAGFGTFLIDVTGQGAQSGSATITGACQDGAPVGLEFVSGWDEGSDVFAVHSIMLTGIDAACVAGTLIVNRSGIGEVQVVPAAGEVNAALTPPRPLGEIEFLDVMLAEQ